MVPALVPPFPRTDRTQNLMELQEELSEEFDEACTHVGLREEWKGLSFSPVVPIPIADLVPGALGWRRDVRLPGETAPSTLSLVLHPKPGGRSLPLVGAQRESFAYVHDFKGDPPAALLAASPHPGAREKLKRLTTAIASELNAE